VLKNLRKGENFLTSLVLSKGRHPEVASQFKTEGRCGWNEGRIQNLISLAKNIEEKICPISFGFIFKEVRTIENFQKESEKEKRICF